MSYISANDFKNDTGKSLIIAAAIIGLLEEMKPKSNALNHPISSLVLAIKYTKECIEKEIKTIQKKMVSSLHDFGIFNSSSDNDSNKQTCSIDKMTMKI